jgi:formylglycine-generating enzyme
MPEHMAYITAGSFLMGSDEFYPEERPVRQVTCSSFWCDRHLVTVAEFRRFVEATGYTTMAERTPQPEDYPLVDPTQLVPGSLVFKAPAGPVGLDDFQSWWKFVPGASWLRPEGPGSSLVARDAHPVVHVAYEDATAYAAWVGKALPTEIEWEYAARGGLDGMSFAWGNEYAPGGRQMANTWQGNFPCENLALDNYIGTSPVTAFPPNNYGLFDMTGNVWEWTSDLFEDSFTTKTKRCCAPSGPHKSGSIDQHVLKGGSHLCAPNYCLRYRPAARQAQSIDTSACHIGFRCVVRTEATYV